MPIELILMTAADVDAHIEIVCVAFGPDLMMVFYPNGFSANDREHMKADTLKSMHKNKPSEEYLYIKAIDTELDSDKQIVSTAKWQIHPRHRSEEQLDHDTEEESRDTTFSEGADVESMKAFFGKLAMKRKERFGGEPYVLLSMLAVHSDHQRRGLGAMQLKVGLEKADELGLQVYLESSPKGKGLYAKYGFKEEGVMEFNGRDYTFMTRPVKAK